MVVMESANAKVTTVLADFLSAPKIMGMGPIIMTPEALTLPLPLFFVEARIIIKTIIIIPTTIKTNPKSKKTGESNSTSLLNWN